MQKPTGEGYAVRRARTLYRVLILVIPLSLFAALAALYATGHQQLYGAILTDLGHRPYEFPFLDLHALLAAADCHRQGIDVYLSNPCDVRGRLHVYSPLWLDLIPAFATRASINPIGFGLDLLFIGALPLVMRPRSAGECLIFVTASLSTTVLYALERANNDVIIFLLVVLGGALLVRARPWRLAAYLAILLGGLLKFYPMALLALVARENWRVACAVAAVAVLAVLALGGAYGDELAIVLGNLPRVSYYSDSISAGNLPWGIAGMFPTSPVPAGTLATAIFAILFAYSGFFVFKIFRALAREGLALDGWSRETAYLLIGAILLTGCFLTGRSISYRGIFLLLVIPGLLRLRSDAAASGLRRLLGLFVTLVLGLLWEQGLGLALNHMLGASLVPDDPNLAMGPVPALYWFCRELVWWAVISLFISLILAFFSRMSLGVDLFGALKRNASAMRTRIERAD
jgi:hypothetical protein